MGLQVRSGRDYYDAWDKKVEAALAEADTGGGGGSSADGAAGEAAAAASTAGLRRSPELTQRLLELNRSLSAPERLALSGQEKAKGNEHFRAKEYVEVGSASYTVIPVQLARGMGVGGTVACGGACRGGDDVVTGWRW